MIYQYYYFIIGMIQEIILNNWKMDAPTILTKIDTWIKRKKGKEQILFLKGDKESVLKWNISLLYYMKKVIIVYIYFFKNYRILLVNYQKLKII